MNTSDGHTVAIVLWEVIIWEVEDREMPRFTVDLSFKGYLHPPLQILHPWTFILVQRGANRLRKA